MLNELNNAQKKKGKKSIEQYIIENKRRKETEESESKPTEHRNVKDHVEKIKLQ